MEICSTVVYPAVLCVLAVHALGLYKLTGTVDIIIAPIPSKRGILPKPGQACILLNAGSVDLNNFQPEARAGRLNTQFLLIDSGADACIIQTQMLQNQPAAAERIIEVWGSAAGKPVSRPRAFLKIKA